LSAITVNKQVEQERKMANDNGFKQVRVLIEGVSPLLMNPATDDMLEELR